MEKLSQIKHFDFARETFANGEKNLQNSQKVINCCESSYA